MKTIVSGDNIMRPVTVCQSNQTCFDMQGNVTCSGRQIGGKAPVAKQTGGKAAVANQPDDKASGMVYGYIRVSTREQNEARQVDAMKKFGVDQMVMDKQSGKDFDRPAYQALLAQLTAGDVLVVKSIDRLGRNYEEILEQWRIITKEKQAAIVVLDMPLLDPG